MSPVRSKFLQTIVQQRQTGAIGGDQTVQAQQAAQSQPQQRRRRNAQGIAGRALLGGA